MALTSSQYLLYKRVELDIEYYSNMCDIRIIPSLCPIKVGKHDFTKSHILMEQGYQHAKEWLEAGMLTAKDVKPQLRPLHCHD